MTLKRKIAAAFKMSDEAWLRRANPWSEGTRFIVLPLLSLVILVIWSWIGSDWRLLLPPIACALILVLLSLFVFPKPRSTNNWISKGVLGERVWLNRDQVPIPQNHRLVPSLLAPIIAASGSLFVLGLLNSNVWGVVFNCALMTLGRLWYHDRMVRLYREMKDANPEYRSWLY